MNLHPVQQVLSCAALLVAFDLAATSLLAAPPAFPGAMGQGAAATGGRGGDVYRVTTLEDYHPKTEPAIKGSFRHALRSITGPRTIVFDVGGGIALRAPIEVYKSNVTIAGQTAPGGITLWGYPFEVSNEATDVIVRHIRVRCGDFHARQGQVRNELPGSRAHRADLDAASAGAISVGDGVNRVIMDHISASWGMDETFSVTRARNVTMQNCLIAESLHESKHPKGAHGYGSLLRGEITPEDAKQGTGGYTLVGNLWAMHVGRNPSFGGQQKLDDGQAEAQRRSNDANFVNNVVYNWGGKPTHRNELGHVRLNMLGNYFINGPARDTKYCFSCNKDQEDGTTEIYHAGNLHDRTLNGKRDGEPLNNATSFQQPNPGDVIRGEGEAEPFNFLGPLAAQVLSADEAYARVVKGVGASLYRDAVDARVIKALETGGGKIIDSQDEFRTANGDLPGIDDLKPAQRAADWDADADGMPNAWETVHQLDPQSPADGNATTLSTVGYTNLEVYLAEAAEKPL